MKNFTQKFIGILALLFTMSFTVNSQAQNNINLPQGWSMFGYNCDEAQEVTPALHEIVDKIVIVKDHFGNAYLPELDFNGIGNFTNGVGYQVKMIEQVDGFQFCSSVLPDDGIGQADLDSVQTELAIALESLSDLTEQMGEIELSYNSEQIAYISEFVNSLLLDVNTLLDSDSLDLNSLTVLAENYLTPGIAYLTNNSLVTEEEVSLLYDILFDIAALVANQEDGIGQADVDAAYDNGAASVTPEDGVSQVDVDAAVAAVEASYEGWCASDIDNDGICDVDEVSGCMDASSCNYVSAAEFDDSSCEYTSCLDDCGVINGDNSTCLDCAGVPNGSSEDLGCGCGNPQAQEDFDCDGNLLLQIGDVHAGGIVFQINEDGTGLVADLENLGLMDWYDAMDAAASATSQGYDDWYIPSLEELELMYNTIAQGADNSGNFSGGYYWSSTEWSSTRAWFVILNTGTTSHGTKANAYWVRVIRAF
jgi:hypothetical protein